LLRIASGRSTLKSALGGHLPGWVHFPEVETIRWANVAVGKLWPAFIPQLDKVLRAGLNPILAANCPPVFTAIQFNAVKFGLKPPRLFDVRCHRLSAGDGSDNGSRRVAVGERTRGRGSAGASGHETAAKTAEARTKSVGFDVGLDMDIRAEDDASLLLTVKTMLMTVPTVVDRVHVRGRVRIEIQGIGGDLPCFESIAITLLDDPTVDFSISPGTDFDLAHMPFLKDAIGAAITQQLRENVVHPNKVVLALRDILPALYDD